MYFQIASVFFVRYQDPSTSSLQSDLESNEEDCVDLQRMVINGKRHKSVSSPLADLQVIIF